MFVIGDPSDEFKEVLNGFGIVQSIQTQDDKCDGCDELKEGLAPVVLKQEIVRHPDVEPKTIDMMGVRTHMF